MYFCKSRKWRPEVLCTFDSLRGYAQVAALVPRGSEHNYYRRYLQDADNDIAVENVQHLLRWTEVLWGLLRQCRIIIPNDR